ncbi:hypothetical protein SEPCBS119000_001673 [Sporothrix epigloea]|uniref:C2H2-type domain-containing protein n=1 Tax=Sporothrix epigloea TaxID=1892477 RepID=A0ABP0DDL6_9PEZI
MAAPAAGQPQPLPQAGGAPTHATEPSFNIVLPALNTRPSPSTSAHPAPPGPPGAASQHEKPTGAASPLTPSETKSEPRPAYRMKRTGRPAFMSASIHVRNGSETPTPTSATTPTPTSAKTLPPSLPTTTTAVGTQSTAPRPEPLPLSKAPQLKLSEPGPEPEPELQPEPEPEPVPEPKPQPEPEPEPEPEPAPVSAPSVVQPTPQSTAVEGQQNGTKRRRSPADDTAIPREKRVKAPQVIATLSERITVNDDLQDLTISSLSDSGDHLVQLESNEHSEMEDNNDDDEKNDNQDVEGEGAEDSDGDSELDIDYYSDDTDESDESDEGDDDAAEAEIDLADNAETLDGDGLPTTTSARGGRTRSSHLVRLTKAPSGRPYNKYRDSKGIELPTKGAIIPDGYQQWHTKATPWLCPIRSCRLLYPYLTGLGAHFTRSHRCVNLNDNLDGTLSVLGVQSSELVQSAARVVSQSKLSDLDPLIEPRVEATDSLPLESQSEARLETKKQVKKEAQQNGHGKQSKKDAAGHDSKKLKKIKKNKQFVEELRVSASGRDYGESIFGGRNFGALFPDGYKLGPHPHLPWVCPVRDCQRITMAVQSLGGHFAVRMVSMRMVFLRFNDNGDGTLSVVGPHAHSRSIIVSQRVRPASELGPLAKQYPLGVKPSEADAAVTAVSTIAGQPTTAAAARANMEALWDYAKTFLSEAMRSAGMPNNGKAALYLTAPRVRELRWNRKVVRTKNSETHATHLAGLLIQLTGEEAQEPCDQCKKGQGPFEGCITVNSNGRPEMLVAYDACANCVTTYGRVPCSLRFEARKRFARLYPHLDYDKVAEQKSFTLQRVFGKEAGPGPGPSLARALLPDSSNSDTSDNEPLVRSAGLRMFGDLEKMEKMEKMRDQLGRRQPERGTDGGESTPSTGALAKSAQKGQDSPLLMAGHRQPALEMEDWEMAPGRVQSAASENIAFSNAYLTSSQMVPINHNMSYRIQVVRPGSMISFEPDAWFTRTCTLASGKLRVTVADTEFVMGPHGMFLVAPGKKFYVQNRLYIDAYLHIIALRNP